MKNTLMMAGFLIAVPLATLAKDSSHEAHWVEKHGATMKLTGDTFKGNCAMCHSESTCSSCHQQTPPRSHTHYWRLKGHGLAVGLNRSQCFSCHRSNDFCERCHAETQPLSHTGSWGTPSNRHCQNCHFPLTSAGGMQCAVCHKETPSHTLSTPAMPSNAKHVTGANCRSCHAPLRHPDNGMTCTTCHQR
ncbi:MAG: hypothetical protein HY540_03920 [Deltaproteobacteria bacterium]|nr:hypothetical protein [Deltaproteobacteria bacterium]